MSTPKTPGKAGTAFSAASAVNPKGLWFEPTQGRWGGILETAKETPFCQENIRKCSGEPACKSTGVRYKGAAKRAGPRGLEASIIPEEPRVLTAGAVKRATAARDCSVGGAASTQLGRGVSWPPTHPPSPPPGASESSAIGWGHP